MPVRMMVQVDFITGTPTESVLRKAFEKVRGTTEQNEKALQEAEKARQLQKLQDACLAAAEKQGLEIEEDF